MRRSLAMITVLALMMMLATVALGAAVTQPPGLHSYKDAFGSVSYSGSDGSIFWESPWKEIGEGDGPSEGAVYVGIDPYCADYKCLHIFGQGEPVSLIGVVRSADLSEFKEANLAYEVKRLFDGNLEGNANAKLLVQVSADGSKWDSIDSYVLETTDSNPIRSSKPITNWISQTFAVRFVVTGTLGSEVFIDNVQITGSVPSEPTTTTTTTVPTTVTTIKTITTVTTIKPTTTTTKPGPTTTTTGYATTTKPPPTTTTTEPTTTTTSALDTTTTTAPTSTTTTTTTTGVAVALPPATPPTGSGIQQTAFGIQADYSSGLFGSVAAGQPEVLGVELNANYKMAVEVIEASWVWMVVLLVVIAGAIVSGLDRRKSPGIQPDA
jgi:hypothetical protein